jgi:hypothetical protein
MQMGHRVLMDAPARVRIVDMAVGMLVVGFRRLLVLQYCWDRDRDGYVIKDAQRARALGVGSARYEEMLGTAEQSAWQNIEILIDRQAVAVQSSASCVTASAVNVA